MRYLSLIIIFSLFTIPAATAASAPKTAWAGPAVLTMEREAPVIDRNLNSLLKSAPGDSAIAVWVFFTDKLIFDSPNFHASLDEARNKLSPTALARRAKSRGEDNVVDFRDIDVSSKYIDQVLSTGAKQRQVLSWFNAITVNAAKSQVEEIARFPFVRFMKKVAVVSSNKDIETAPISPDMSLVSLNYGPSFGQLDQINVIPAHELGFAGQDVIVCMMDTGFRQGHNAFANIIGSGRLIAQYDFINNDNNTDYDPGQDISSQPWHGTLTWSTLGGEASGHLYGPAYLASFVLSKTEDITSERHIEEDNWAAGAIWADGLGASVISASLGYRLFDSGQGDYSYSDLDGNTTIVAQAADLAAYNGIAVATAMGNEGNTTGSLVSPSDADSVIGCGAVNSSGSLAGFSSFGPTSDGRTKPEICAQGVSTVCVDPDNNSGYTTASGTSLSTPLIGGVCAVLFSAHPNWTPMMVREALMMTADRYDTPANDYGWGILDAARALYYHPAGDILFTHSPVLLTPSNQIMNISANITGGSGISNAYIYYRVDGTGGYTEVAMTTSDGHNFSGQIPGQTGSYIEYYLKAVDTNARYAFHPVGGEAHPFKAGINGSTIIDDFENGPQLWIAEGTYNFWGLSARNPRSGNLSITDSPTTNYRNNTNSTLRSAFKLNLTSVSSAALSFWYKGTIQSGDYLAVEISTDGGLNWTALGSNITGSYSNYMQYSADLGSYSENSNVSIRFHMVANGSSNADGIYIDDIQITMTPAVVPTLSQWGLILLGLLLALIGTIAIIAGKGVTAISKA